MVTQFTGQADSHLPPQAMHLPAISAALPRGFLTGFFGSLMWTPCVVFSEIRV
jgi:hypothetical protein